MQHETRACALGACGWGLSLWGTEMRRAAGKIGRQIKADGIEPSKYQKVTVITVFISPSL